MKSLNIIADVAGEYDALRRLIDKMPEGEPVSVGDMIDRGDKSNEVVAFFMKHGRAVLGNHENMCVDYLTNGLDNEYYKTYRWQAWLGNGGKATLLSYGKKAPDGSFMVADECDAMAQWNIPPEHLAWLQSLPNHIEVGANGDTGTPGLIITHAPINPVWGFEKLKSVPPIADHSLCWNRGRPKEIENVVQIFGHEATHSVKYYGPKDSPWAMGIDTSRARILTGVHWPSLEIFQEEY